MKFLALLISIVALALSFQAYQNTKSLEQLRPLAEAVAEAKTITKGAKERAAGAKETAGQMLIDLGREIKGKN